MLKRECDLVDALRCSQCGCSDSIAHTHQTNMDDIPTKEKYAISGNGNDKPLKNNWHRL